MPFVTPERIIVIRMWIEAVTNGHTEWRGTLRVIGSTDPGGSLDNQTMSFHGRSGLLEGIGALIPVDENNTPPKCASTDNNLGV